MTAEPKLIRELAVKDRRTGAIGVRKVYSDRSHVDIMPMSITARKSGARENKSMNYPGGKGAEGVFQTIINQMPKHRVYIEPFLGGGAILRKKRPADTTWACEFESDAFKRFEPGADSGYFHNNRLIDIMADLEAQQQRQWNDARGLPSLFLIHQDGLKFLRDYLFQGDKANTMIYCDPPYLMDTRSSKSKIYAEEFHTREKHTELLNCLLSLTAWGNANIMISGYDHPLYNEMLSDWRKISFQGISRGGPRTEVIWMNYPEPVELHDYRYLGADYREREQIARQTRRWIAKLEAMPVQRRLALISSIEDHFTAAGIATNGDAAASELPAGNIAGTSDVLDDTADTDGAIAQTKTPATIAKKTGNRSTVAQTEKREIKKVVAELEDAAVNVFALPNSSKGITSPMAKVLLFEDSDRWNFSVHISTTIGGSGYTSPADYSTREEALHEAMVSVLDHARAGFNRKDSVATAASRKQYRQIIEWACSIHAGREKLAGDHSPSEKAMPAIAV